MTDYVRLPFTSNSLQFRFYTPDYGAPESYSYAYKLEGFSSDYQYSTNNAPIAQFNNLPAGKYQLRVKVTQPYSTWSQEMLSPVLIISPPWYKSTWAYIAYVLTLSLGVILLMSINKKQLNLKNAAKIALLEKQNSEKMNNAKLRFFTDIAHEIRTPLTLILGPLMIYWKDVNSMLQCKKQWK